MDDLRSPAFRISENFCRRSGWLAMFRWTAPCWWARCEAPWLNISHIFPWNPHVCCYFTRENGDFTRENDDSTRENCEQIPSGRQIRRRGVISLALAHSQHVVAMMDKHHEESFKRNTSHYLDVSFSHMTLVLSCVFTLNFTLEVGYENDVRVGSGMDVSANISSN